MLHFRMMSLFKKSPRCTFCDDKKGPFIERKGAFICEKCALECAAILEDNRQKQREKEAQAWES